MLGRPVGLAGCDVLSEGVQEEDRSPSKGGIKCWRCVSTRDLLRQRMNHNPNSGHGIKEKRGTKWDFFAPPGMTGQDMIGMTVLLCPCMPTTCELRPAATARRCGGQQETALLAAAVTNCFLHHYRHSRYEKKTAPQSDVEPPQWPLLGEWAILDSNQ